MSGNGNELRVLGISGSPRVGNSSYLLNVALEAAAEVNRELVRVESYSFRGKNFGPCLGCFKCSQEKHMGECAIKDDFQHLRDLWLGADAVIYSTPVYHVSIPGQLKCFIDRLGNTINKYYRLTSPRFMKVVGAIAQGMHLFGGQELTINFLLQHAVLKNCIPVSGDGWQSYLGAAGWTGAKREGNSIKRQFESTETDAEVVVQAAESLGRRVTELALILRQGLRHLEDACALDDAYGPILERVRVS
ncbi:MAG: flavodoxin family protein [Proteobacteria bacterium]|nr:flavodoxin family protein [Pseudomonadota bacterium]